MTENILTDNISLGQNISLMGNVDLNKIIEPITFLSKTITEKLTEILIDAGLQVSQRWTSGLLIFISLGIIYMSMKITKPLLKWGLTILGLILFIGLILPVW